MQGLIQKRNKFWILLININPIFLASAKYLYELKFMKMLFNINKKKEVK